MEYKEFMEGKDLQYQVKLFIIDSHKPQNCIGWGVSSHLPQQLIL